MLTHPTLDMLRDLGLHGMAKGFQDIEAQPEARALDHGEWLAILLEQEATLRRQKRFEARARAARLRHDAQVEDADFRAERGLDRSLFLKLAGCDWIRQRHGLLITGPAGVGKSWLAHLAFRQEQDDRRPSPSQTVWSLEFIREVDIIQVESELPQRGVGRNVSSSSHVGRYAR